MTRHKEPVAPSQNPVWILNKPCFYCKKNRAVSISQSRFLCRKCYTQKLKGGLLEK